MLYFITETYLKTNTPITANVDVTDVTPYIATQSRTTGTAYPGHHVLQSHVDSLQQSNSYTG
jgi:hypothetical protein